MQRWIAAWEIHRKGMSGSLLIRFSFICNVRGKRVEMFESSLPGYSRWLPIDLRRELVTALRWLYLQVRPAASALVDLVDLRMGQPDLSSCIFYPLCRWDNIKKKQFFFSKFSKSNFFLPQKKYQFFFHFFFQNLKNFIFFFFQFFFIKISKSRVIWARPMEQ